MYSSLQEILFDFEVHWTTCGETCGFYLQVEEILLCYQNEQKRSILVTFHTMALTEELLYFKTGYFTFPNQAVVLRVHIKNYI